MGLPGAASPLALAGQGCFQGLQRPARTRQSAELVDGSLRSGRSCGDLLHTPYRTQGESGFVVSNAASTEINQSSAG